LRDIAPGDQEIDEVVDGGVVERLGEGRHSPRSLSDHLRELLARSLVADPDERRPVRRAFEVVGVAARAIRAVERLVIARDEAVIPRHFIRIHI
jgi:hypothetical protein